MEAHISDKRINEVDFTMHVVQSVRLSAQARRECFVKALAADDRVDERLWREYPSWLKDYNALHHTFRNTYCRNLVEEDGVSREDVASSFDACVSSSIGRYLAEDDPFEAFLFYGPHLRQWLILHRVRFRFPQEELAALIQESLDPDEGARDLYNELRDAFVVTNGEGRKAAFVAVLEQRARRLIAEGVRQLYSVSMSADDVEIVDSSGNITFFVSWDDVACESELASSIARVHEKAERQGSTAEPLGVPDAAYYAFWGRFHTVITKEPHYENRYMPIHFQAQLLWSYLSTMNLVMQEVEDSALAHVLDRDKSCSEFMDALINSVQYADFMNEDFKRSIEGDYGLIYRYVEKRWHLDDMLLRLRDFSLYLSDCVKRDFQKRSLASEARQNKILTAIALLGVLALIETWANYLGLVGEAPEGVLANELVGSLFADMTVLMAFNTWFPVVVTLICMLAIAYTFIRRS